MLRRSCCLFFLLAALWFPLTVRADDAAREAAALALDQRLRCPVCAGQTIHDSQAALAQDMRAEVRRRLAAGETPEAIQQYFVMRYGPEVLLNPAFTAQTALLWAFPVLLLAGGMGVVLLTRHRRGDRER